MTIFGLKVMVKSGLEKIILKFHVPLQSCCCPVQKNLPRKAELAWLVSRYLWRGTWNFKIMFLKVIWNRWLCVSFNIRWHLKLFLMFYKIWIASVDCISMYWNLWFNSQMSTFFANLTTTMALFLQMAPH